MNILVCIKQVFDPELPVEANELDGSLLRRGQPRFQMNRYDEFAVEAAVVLKKAFKDVSVDVLTVGLASARTVLERAIGMGCDEGVHIVVTTPDALDGFATASLIAQYAKNKSYDLVLCGIMSEDQMRAQVGPMLAEILALPCATAVIDLSLNDDKSTVLVQRETEGGVRDGLEIILPAVLTVQSGINKPRYPSLSNLLRAKTQEIKTIEPGLPSILRENISSYSVPGRTRQGLVLKGDVASKADQLAAILRDKALI